MFRSFAILTSALMRQFERLGDLWKWRSMVDVKNDDSFPVKLKGLHKQEEFLRSKAVEVIEGRENLKLHLEVIEHAMDVADIFRQYDTDDEDLKVIQVLGMRTFNAFGASLKLALSGYHQNAALIMRDVLETVFLVDLFRRDRSLIERWRFAEKKDRMKEFRPMKVRMTLDKLDGFSGKKRAAIYELFSELAGHPTMKSSWMMRPQKDGDAVIGPFMEPTALEAVVSEMGRLAVQVGEMLFAFIPEDWEHAVQTRTAFTKAKRKWIVAFYPHS